MWAGHLCYHGIMRPSNSRSVLSAAISGAVGLAAIFAPQASLAQPSRDAVSTTDQAAVMIELAAPPAVVVYAAQQREGAFCGGSRDSRGGAGCRIVAEQAQLQQQLAAYDTPVLFSVQRVYNGVAVLANGAERERLRSCQA